jgi:flavin reductase (DIM6/NTAB) family NADH-FMN oxidoreductase RutF
MDASRFHVIDPDDLKENPFSMIGKDWMLLTASNGETFNTMTIAWGTLGVLWWKPVMSCYVRPDRYTAEFLEAGSYYTFSALGPEHREALEFCGSRSGRTVDKVKETGLTPVRLPAEYPGNLELEESVVAFAEARTILVCRKIWYEDIQPPHVLDDALRIRYEEKKQHRMYVGEIVACLST